MVRPIIKEKVTYEPDHAVRMIEERKTSSFLPIVFLLLQMRGMWTNTSTSTNSIPVLTPLEEVNARPHVEEYENNIGRALDPSPKVRRKRDEIGHSISLFECRFLHREPAL